MKSAKSITTYKRLKKTMNKKIIHGLHNMFYFERKKHSFSIFTVLVCGNLSTSIFFFFLSCFFSKGVSYCHKMLRLSCRGPKSCPVWTSMNCMGKKTYSSAWQNTTTGNCEFNVWLIYLNFKIRYQSIKTWSIGEALYELNTKYWLDYHHQRLSFKCCSYQF